MHMGIPCLQHWMYLLLQHWTTLLLLVQAGAKCETLLALVFPG